MEFGSHWLELCCVYVASLLQWLPEEVSACSQNFELSAPYCAGFCLDSIHCQWSHPSCSEVNWKRVDSYLEFVAVEEEEEEGEHLLSEGPLEPHINGAYWNYAPFYFRLQFC